VFSQGKYNKEILSKSVNSEYSEVSPIISPDGKTIYFVRVNHPKNTFGNEDSQDIWFSELDENDDWKAAKRMINPFNRNKYNDILNITPDGNKVLIKGVYKKGNLIGKGFSFIHKTERGWSEPEKLNIAVYESIDVGNYSGGFLSNDSRVLLMYFSEKIDGNICDLYISFLKKSGKWTKPKSLGKTVNAKKADDISPFLAPDGKTLYFSSDREGGFGSKDIYMTKRLDDSWKKWSEPVNLGKTINSAAWEAYYSLDVSGEFAYMVSSDKISRRGDIVRIRLKEEIRPDPVVIVTGVVYNSKTNLPVEASIVYSILAVGDECGVAKSNPNNGEYKIILPYGENYSFSANAEGYFAVSDNLNLTEIEEFKEIKKDLFLAPIEVGRKIRLNNIFFDYNKSSLREESFFELDKIYNLMNESPLMEIQIDGHTDNVGSPASNLVLSEERAEAVKNYIIKKGIDKKRITAKGFGEENPINSNETESGKQKNRRVEFTILKK
jgi:outer membrane protein OmpA-like peptidoglycan-associated protein